MTAKTTSILACCASMGLLAALAPKVAHADGHAVGVGGHIGVAVPIVFLNSDDTKTIGDKFVIAHPIGIGFKISEKAAIDFETIIGNSIHPRAGGTGLTVDPGIVYDTGPFVIGLRLKWDVGSATNYGVIPLIHKAVADIGGGANWFVELALPTTLSFSSDTNGQDHTTFDLDVVLHTGIGF